MSWCTDAPEDEAISLFAGLLADPDVPLSPLLKFMGTATVEAATPPDPTTPTVPMMWGSSFVMNTGQSSTYGDDTGMLPHRIVEGFQV
jgi:hypothetical protein